MLTGKLAIVGSRTYPTDYDSIKVIAKLVKGWDVSEIVSGKCPYGGADSLAEVVAEVLKKPFKGFPPERKTAPYFKKRNAQIAEYADSCLCLLDKPIEESRGSFHIVSLFMDLDKDILLYTLGEGLVRY